jgi:hypothetical protein
LHGLLPRSSGEAEAVELTDLGLAGEADLGLAGGCTALRLLPVDALIDGLRTAELLRPTTFDIRSECRVWMHQFIGLLSFDGAHTSLGAKIFIDGYKDSTFLNRLLIMLPLLWTSFAKFDASQCSDLQLGARSLCIMH